jgi:hypothetical protein
MYQNPVLLARGILAFFGESVYIPVENRRPDGRRIPLCDLSLKFPEKK